MKLRRTMALAAATAVIAPVVLLSAPAAYADPETTTAETASPDPSASPSDEETAPEETTSEETASGETKSPSPDTEASESPASEATEEAGKPGEGGTKPSASPSTTAPATSKPTATPSEETDPEEETPACEPRPLELSVKGLAGKIVRGSGWHTFELNAYNDSKKTVHNVLFYAGASTDKHGDDLFTTKQVELQALAEGTWEEVSEADLTAGIVGATDVIKPGYEVDIPLRVKVKKSAPVGAGFTLGGGLVFGDDSVSEPCFTDVSYRFQIVEAGDEDGSKPQEGGKIPVPSTTKPNAGTAQLTGSLAETGSSSSTPVIALAGGAAVVLGAGAMFVVRRRSNGGAAA
ncbi:MULTISPECIES: LAETG motif-containing sortase-dependent surface protein [unclassified Streptomyces]|uniref:LAETG motif-containing sortase-dependent surface protein n=1 Tax=Streptomyces TaxID=1883 RepID=UPI0001C1AB46|nr:MULTISPECIES: LAETG motif-containing sortase-dependent surface protein [unclassified Streptomyces]AEN11891.1 LPXTG-motif cell wall anchor domain protein [Streptomyces sp. SirexAA-E]MYR65077.1 LPXTG cell wall anchor domain-containing protein [Streptomyces sp. SID4939]MYS03945.1 LPXTG cell wall anchor domain-containing protein [Streptomyces sp. SID4940]MYT65170.1 LPXTG cell wall anchor domain-containing protein [Streptomyces sp. SID8357]MYT84954.1 LPXTG cell wall anchor domain-containing prot